MDAAELDVALEELETRLERLRALYEQYFMGLEKIEPAIARKDVDRRIYVLRREKIRNTAKRFKLQTIIQRYNTFQQYWQRICREIENGTYKRHLLKAQRKGELLTIAARKRIGRVSSAPPPAAASQPPAPPSAPPLAAVAAVPAATPPAAAAPATASPVPRPLGSPPPPKRPPLPSRPDAGPVPVAVAAAPDKPAPRAAEPPATPVAARPAASAPTPAPAKFESLDLDMDFMGDWDPGARKGAPPAKPAAASPPIKPVPVATPPKPAAAPPPKPAAAPPPKPTAAPPPKPTAPAARVAPPAVAPPPPLAPVPARPASIPPAPVAAPPRPASSRPPTAPTRPLAPRVPPAVRPAPAERVPAAAAKPAPAPAPKPAAAAASGGGVDDARLRDLHSKLQQAKQQTKEANVSYEGLAKSIRATEAKLREQHKNRKIEFDVVIKDGKAVVKPIVR